MKVLVVGSGGREHALAWKIAQSERVTQTFVAPGNAGTAAASDLTNVPLSAGDIPALCDWITEHQVGLVVVGPEAPLVDGLADRLRERGVAVVGPNADGALLEGSKAFAKEIMSAAAVPTARYARAETAADVDAFCDAFDGAALVVKADGLAGGKGVVVCDDVEQARVEAKAMLAGTRFGEASASLVLEERLIGIETSYIVLVDGERYVALPTSQDHKRLLDGDRGPNTGGMGAYSPAPYVSTDDAEAIERDVIRPTIAELRRRGIDFRGFLYAGIMLTDDGPMVLEFNVRLGDPETQALMAAMHDDIVPWLQDAAAGKLSPGAKLKEGRASAVIVLAAEGYPVAPVKGAAIDGVDGSPAPNSVVFHAGTSRVGDALVVNGGRVLGVTAWAETPEEAVARAYAASDRISWPGMQRREDIGKQLSV